MKLLARHLWLTDTSSSFYFFSLLDLIFFLCWVQKANIVAQAENVGKSDQITSEPCCTIEDQPTCEVSML